MSCSEWKEYRLDEVCTITDCQHKTAPTVDYKTEYKMLRTTNIRNGKIDKENVNYVTRDTYEKWSSRGYLVKDDVVLTREAPMGEVGIIKTQDKFFLGQRILQLKANKNLIIPDFLYYSLLSPHMQNQIRINEGTGSVVSNIRIPILKNMTIKIPSIEYQKKVCANLSCLDKKIELNNEMNKTLEEMAQIIFKRWFVDFEFPNEHGKPYKSSGGEMVESELGMIPKGWEVKKYINISDIQYGYAFKSKLFNEVEGMPIIRIRDISNNFSPTFTTEEYNDIYIVQKNDILVGMDGEFKAHIWSGKNALLNQRVLRIRPKEQNSLAFNYFAIKEPLRYLENAKVGTTVIHLGRKDIDEIKVIYPTLDLIKKYKDISDNIIKQISEYRFENRYLSDLRCTILPKLINGEIKLDK